MEKKVPRFLGVQSAVTAQQPQTRFNDDDPISVQNFLEEIKSEDSVRCSLQFCFDYVQLSSSINQEIPVCLYIESGAGSQTQGRPGVDLVFIIDISGSMMGPKLELVKKTIEFTVSKLSPSDRVSLVTFNNSTNRLCPLLSMTDRNKSLILKLVNQINAFGGTEIIEGLNLGLKVMSDRRIVNSVSSIILLSDGKDNNSHSALPRAKESLIKSVHEIDSGFSIHTFGYGGDHDAQLMNAIAEEKNGGFYFIDDESKISMIFSNCLGELMSVVADNIQVDLEDIPCDVNCRIGKVYSETLTRTFRMPPVLYGDSKSAVFLMEFPPFACDFGEVFDITPAKATVRYKLMKSGQVFVDECILKICVYPEGLEIEDMQLEADVMTNFYRVKAAEVMKEAARLADSGDIPRARQALMMCTSELSSCIVGESDIIKQIINDIQEAISKLPNQIAYEVGGRADIMSKARNHLAQRAVKPNTYQNYCQSALNVESANFMKKKN